jgi:hypothetical protein
METLLSIAIDEPTLGSFVPNRKQRRDSQRETAKLRKDKHRRRRYLSQVRADPSVIRSTVATLEALLEHSDDTASPVWPCQERLARLACVSVRTVQRHLKELRDAGYLLVYVYAPTRNERTGQYQRRKTNRYYFCFTSEPGNGHRVRRNGRSHLHDTDGVSNPLGISNHRPSGGGGGSIGLVIEGVRRLGGAKAPPPPQPSVWSDDKGCDTCEFTGWVFDAEGLAGRCTCSGRN